MTANEYVGKSKELAAELMRIRNILDQAAQARQIGLRSETNLQILQEWDDVIRKFNELEREFWTVPE